ncbi:MULTISPECIES: DUF397 domain-containing protein [Streptomyces]|uniref:DUF397 domain-containing protein n=1 Tax=Streptomyces TaxID=1883 RepID=UPI000A391472
MVHGVRGRPPPPSRVAHVPPCDTCGGVSPLQTGVLVRDSKVPHGEILTVSADTFVAFLDGLGHD